MGTAKPRGLAENLRRTERLAPLKLVQRMYSLLGRRVSDHTFRPSLVRSATRNRDHPTTSVMSALLLKLSGGAAVI